jgi:predicted lipoprotein with Yx(FWY)xxD motif
VFELSKLHRTYLPKLSIVSLSAVAQPEPRHAPWMQAHVNGKESPAMFEKMRSRTTAAAALAAAALFILAACGGDDSTTSPGASTTGQTVSVQDVDGVGEVLVDSEGSALYAADQEARGEVLCIEGCASIWLPLTLPTGRASPTAAADLAGNLGVVMRPDGGEQVTFDGRPLYRFVEDRSPGVVTGDGFADVFAGQPFEWHVVGPDGVSDVSRTGPLGY